MAKDDIFSVPQKKVKPFSFNSEVAEVFDDMIGRSVPFYNELQDLISNICLHYYKPNTNIYDLGCSTAETLIRIARKANKKLPLIGIDNSADMLEKAKHKCQLYPFIKLIKDDITSYKLENPSVIYLTYVLQFIEPQNRLRFIKSIYDALPIGGILILSEKILIPGLNKAITKLHEQFKASNYYSELEIKQKREALENVLITYSLEENLNMLKQAGFTHAESVFQYLNFCSILAVK